MGVVHRVKHRVAAAAASQQQEQQQQNQSLMSDSSTPSPAGSVSSASSSSPSSPASPKYPRFGKRGAPQAFPSKLYEILEGENPEIVGWTATGRGFEVRDHARLSSEVLGRFFKQDKFSSFQRQLNLYGFRKITKGSEAGSYQHPHFRRGERTTLLTIRRSTKASPARNIPCSPASTSGASLAPSVSSKARSATPSPPPTPVSQGDVAPWARAADGHGVNAEGGVPAISADSRPGDADTPSDCRYPQAGSWPANVGGGGGYAEPADGTSNGAGGGWTNADRSTSAQGKCDSWDKTERNSPADLNSGTYAAASSVSGSQRWSEERAVKIEREAAQGLDHQDVTMVDLLQRMGKEGQDSPSKKGPSTGRWVEGDAHETAVSRQQQQHAQQPQFRLPASAVEFSDKKGQGQPVEFAERFYDILHHDGNTGNATRGCFPFNFGAKGRVNDFPRQQSPGTSLASTAPYSNTSSSSDGSQSSPRHDSLEPALSSHHAVNEMSEHDRRALLAQGWRAGSPQQTLPAGAYGANAHQHQHSDASGRGRTGTVSPSLDARTGPSPISDGAALSRYQAYDRQYNDGHDEQAANIESANNRRGSVEMGNFKHGTPWRGPNGPYMSSTTPSAFSNFQMENSAGAGNMWAQQQQRRPFEGGTRIVH